MLDEFGLTPEQRAQHLEDARKELDINSKRNQGYAGWYIDPDDEDLVLRWKLLKEKVEAKQEELRQRAIARNNGQSASSDISEPVSDSPYERSRNFMAAFRRFMGL